MDMKIQLGFGSALFVPLHSVCSKRLRVVQSARDEDEGNPDMCRKKNSTSEKQAQRAPGACECIYTRFFTQTKNVFTPVQRSRPTSVLLKEGTSFSNINCILLASKHTWQIHKCIFIRIKSTVYIHSYIHTVHTPLGAQQTTWKEAEDGC